jgi:ABC-2 type transport system permease protein
MVRYFRLWLALARFSLLRELAFRGNFLIKMFVEVLWLSILLAFYYTLFQKTSIIADWNAGEYLFFVGVYFALNGTLEMLFLENCNQFADLVRTGDLDFFLLKPIDEQFLVSFRTVDWSAAANFFMGAGVMIFALIRIGKPLDPLRVGLFCVLFVSGVALAYGFLLMLTSASVWFMRNQSLYEMWWLFATLMRYPREIFTSRGWLAATAGSIFTIAVPIMLVTNIPASVMVRALEPWFVLYTLAATVVVVLVSRAFFRYALRRYRSASS